MKYTVYVNKKKYSVLKNGTKYRIIVPVKQVTTKKGDRE